MNTAREHTGGRSQPWLEPAQTRNKSKVKLKKGGKLWATSVEPELGPHSTSRKCSLQWPVFVPGNISLWSLTIAFHSEGQKMLVIWNKMHMSFAHLQNCSHNSYHFRSTCSVPGGSGLGLKPYLPFFTATVKCRHSHTHSTDGKPEPARLKILPRVIRVESSTWRFELRPD